MEQSEPLRLVLDSGATTCRFICYRDPSSPVIQGKVCGLNYTEAGEDGVAALFSELFDSLGREIVPEIIGIALAGAGRSDINRSVKKDLKKCLPRNWGKQDCFLFHDGEAALWAALGDKSGVVTAAGTGSIAFGRDPAGNVLRAGGWGRLAGDEGSAYWIGLMAIRLTLRSSDGRDVPTLLDSLLLNKIDLSETQELVAWVHACERTKDEIAALAPVVQTGAEKGDILSLRILDEAALELSVLTKALLRRGVFSGPVSVGTTGSVFRRNKRVFNSFKKNIIAQYPEADVKSPCGDNMEGAILFTEALAEESDIRKNSIYSW